MFQTILQLFTGDVYARLRPMLKDASVFEKKFPGSFTHDSKQRKWALITKL